MGIILPFERHCAHKERREYAATTPAPLQIESTYRHDVERATELLVKHVGSGLYDGIALALKPVRHEQKLVTVLGGAFRHQLHAAAEAALQLHLAIQIRARADVQG